MGFGLINSIFIWGALTISIPIIIHLLFKRQYKKISWAAIQFLKEAENRIRKRLRLIELLLLLLRCLILLFIVLLFGKIYIDHSGMVSRILGGKSVFYHIIIDDSCSMNLKTNDLSPFKSSIANISALVKNLCDKNEETFISIYRSSDPEHPIFQKVLLNHENYPNLIKGLENIKPLSTPIKPEIILDAVKKQINADKETYVHSLKIYSDFRDADWFEISGESLKSNLETLLNTVSNVYLMDAGKMQKNNLAITDIKVSEKKIIQNVPLKFNIEISNFSTTSKKNVEVVMKPYSGVKVNKIIAEIKPNEKQFVTFTFTFKEPGNFEMQWLLNEDELLEDNVRNLAVDVDTGLKILLVDGDPDRNKSQAETKFLQTALAPPGETFSGNQVDIKTESEFEVMSPDDYDLIYLCNLYRIQPQNIQQLQNWVQAGGKLVITLGDQIDYNYYNEYLFSNGKGLMPGRIVKMHTMKKDEKAHLSDVNLQHPIFNSFAEEAGKTIYVPGFYAWWVVDISSEKNSNVLARYDVEDKPVAILEKKLQQGKVFLYTSSIDDDWNNWPSEFSFLITQLELVKYCLNDQIHSFSLVAGDMIQLKLNPNNYKNKLIFNDQVNNLITPLSPVTQNQNELLFQYKQTNHLGFYHFDKFTNKESKESVIFAVNTYSKEGAIEKFAMQKAVEVLAMPNVYYELVNTSNVLDIKDAKNEFWKSILLVIVCLMIAETSVAWYFGGKR